MYGPSLKRDPNVAGGGGGRTHVLRYQVGVPNALSTAL